MERQDDQATKGKMNFPVACPIRNPQLPGPRWHLPKEQQFGKTSGPGLLLTPRASITAREWAQTLAQQESLLYTHLPQPEGNS